MFETGALLIFRLGLVFLYVPICTRYLLPESILRGSVSVVCKGNVKFSQRLIARNYIPEHKDVWGNGGIKIKQSL
jgi:hypothetical protein